MSIFDSIGFGSREVDGGMYKVYVYRKDLYMLDSRDVEDSKNTKLYVRSFGLVVYF